MTKKDLHFLIIILFLIVLVLYIGDIYKSYKVSSIKKEATTYKVLSYLNSKRLFTNSPNGVVNIKNIEHRPTIFFQKKIFYDDEITLSILRKLQEKFGNKLLIIENLKDKTQNSEFLSFYDKGNKIKNIINIKSHDILVLFSISKPVFFQNDQYHEMENYIRSAIDSTKFTGLFPTINTSKNIKTYLNSPSYLLYKTNNSYFKNKKAKKPLLFISNSGNNNILVSLASGKIIEQIGNGSRGSKNGNFLEAKLNLPRGLLYDNKKNLLYVADAGNNLIKSIDLKNKKISNLIGYGGIGSKITKKQQAKNINLFYPHGLSFYDKQKYIVFSNSGTKQLLKYDRKNQTISPLLKTKEAQKIQHPTNIYNIRDNLYILDKMRYIKVINKNLKVKTIFTASKFHLISDFIIQDNAIFFSEKKTKSIFKYMLNNNNIISAKAELYHKLESSPNSMVSIINKIYIASDNISYFDRVADNKLKQYKIIPPDYDFATLSIKSNKLKIPQNITKISTHHPKVIIDINGECKVENNSLTFLNFFQYSQKNYSINLLKQKRNFSIDKKNIIDLPQIKIGNLYLLRGSIYCCNDNKKHQCQIKEVSKFFLADAKGKVTYKIHD
jgi:hypothetical protein